MTFEKPEIETDQREQGLITMAIKILEDPEDDSLRVHFPIEEGEEGYSVHQIIVGHVEGQSEDLILAIYTVPGLLEPEYLPAYNSSYNSWGRDREIIHVTDPEQAETIKSLYKYRLEKFPPSIIITEERKRKCVRELLQELQYGINRGDGYSQDMDWQSRQVLRVIFREAGLLE